MKKFTCKEMGGPCDAEFSGDTAQAVADQGGKHIMDSTDDAHKPMKDQMAASSEEDKTKWMADFQQKFDAKPDA